MDAIGIDLGTTFSAVAAVDEHGNAQLLADSESVRLVPSVLLFEEDGTVLVGRVAKQYAVMQPDRVVEFVKREMGKDVSQFSRTFDNTTYDAEQLSALILKKLKQQAEFALGRPVTSAVITVPAYFGDRQRTATLNAGRLAGLEVKRLLDEPVAAAIASGLDHRTPDGRFLVFDLGGGTLDVSVVEKFGTRMEVLATRGDHQLGGKDWDDRLVTYAAEQFNERHGTRILTDLATWQDLQARANQVKEALSQKTRAPMLVQHKGTSMKLDITRELFESLSQTLLTRCQYICETALEAANCSWSAMSMVLLVGGSTRMPMVTAMLDRLSGVTVGTVLNPDEAVARGAALAAAATTEAGLVRLSPAGQQLTRVQECTAHSLGVITKESRAANAPDLLSNVIPRGSVIGRAYEEVYQTLHDSQATVQFRVIEGETLEGGQQIGECVLSGIPPSPAGRKLRFALSYDSDHRLTATATDVLTGLRQTVTIQRSSDQTPQAFAAAKAEIALRKVE